MNTQPFVTACPACGTRFRVHSSQLQAAGGRVRCGACLEVFSARPDTAEDVASEEAELGAAHSQLEIETDAARGDERSAAADERVHAAHASSRFQLADAPAPAAAVASDPVARRRSVLDKPLEPGLTTEQRSQFDVLALDPELPPTTEPRRGRALLIVALGVLLVAGQALYFKAGEWASIPTVRPIYDGLCWAIGCTVPMYRDLAAMRGTNVIVRPHPERNDLLLVDAQILNTAPYPQAFPDLRLDLLDRDGSIVSSRVFEPDDYRGGELATMPGVPPNRPLQVALEVYRPRVDVADVRFELQAARAGK